MSAEPKPEELPTPVVAPTPLPRIIWPQLPVLVSTWFLSLILVSQLAVSGKWSSWSGGLAVLAILVNVGGMFLSRQICSRHRAQIASGNKRVFYRVLFLTGAIFLGVAALWWAVYTTTSSDLVCFPRQPAARNHERETRSQLPSTSLLTHAVRWLLASETEDTCHLPVLTARLSFVNFWILILGHGVGTLLRLSGCGA
ncbi:hypothetical protein DACRYDRAFT_24232 [Dacryopinax primogenitus]|uniref:Uncharacterized protein n=1 Tax=Dacryopinax primogenitus (strain DJM 731) TaxID=1858805 RepID=M5FS54_DACPD|nr:uncharacterized protein DACRYDRAFT_24232 [Dacryopinax primogenitus]EJT98623.1 hypothetical protein DACRYDRAFT_24232 [Dacryopinax primogenitus]